MRDIQILIYSTNLHLWITALKKGVDNICVKLF